MTLFSAPKAPLREDENVQEEAVVEEVKARPFVSWMEKCCSNLTV